MDKRIIGALIAVVIIAAIGAAVVLYTPTPAEEEQVTAMMSFIPVTDWNPFYVAIDKGYYADEGLDVTMQYSTEGSMGPIKQVASGKTQFGIASGASLITARSQDVPVVAIYQVVHVNPYGVIAKKGSGIIKPSDLVGKSVAISGAGSPTDIMTKAILYKSGVDYNNVTFVPVGAAQISSLLEDKTDAIGGHLFFDFLLKSMGVETDAIWAKDCDANLVDEALITNEELLKNNPELVRKFVKATKRGLEYAIEHPEEATDIYIKFNPDAAEKRDFNLEYWETYVNELVQPNKYPLDQQFDHDRWTMTQDTLYDIEVIDRKTDITTMYTNEFVAA
jgi:NitT/TauT family transport system substrate-binding protein